MIKNFLCLIICVLGLFSCKSDRQKPAKETLTVSIEPIRYFTEAIAGDKFNVVSMVPEGGNPETYDPTPQQMVALHKSRAFLRIGYIGYEQVWMEKIQDNVPELEIFDLSEGINLIKEACTHHTHTHTSGVEPHIWNSIPNARIIANNILHALQKLTPEHTDYYRQRTDSLFQQIHKVEMEVNAYMQNTQGAFLIFHPALTYFAQDYGWTQLNIEEGGKEPSPAHLQQIIRQCKEKEVKTIFIQKEFDTRNAELIAREIGAEMVSINPLSYHWDEEMIQIAKVLGK